RPRLDCVMVFRLPTTLSAREGIAEPCLANPVKRTDDTFAIRKRTSDQVFDLAPAHLIPAAQDRITHSGNTSDRTFGIFGPGKGTDLHITRTCGDQTNLGRH